MTQNAARHRIGMSLLGASLLFVFAQAPAFAQSGSAGGSIGNDDKSISGSRSAEPDRSARRSKPDAEESRRSSSRKSGGGGSSFDGAWIVVSTGTTCAGSSTSAVVVSGGRIIGEGLTGTISPSGVAHSVGHYNGVTVISSGRASGRNGSGTFSGSDGCSGHWTSSKQ